MVFPILGGNSAVAGYSIDNSLRFNSSDTPNLARTPSASNRDLFTISLWAKRSNLNTGARQVLFGVGNPATTSQVGFEIRFDNSVGDGKLRIGDYIAGVTDYVYLVTDAIFRDVSAWYHIVYVYDSAQATNTDRTKLYVNGTQITSFSSPTYPNQNQDSAVNSATQHTIGNQDGNGYEYNGYMAEMHLVDGQALSPTNFGEFDSDSGIWKPIQYTGSYGTNGFYLDFENSGSLGADQSGNGNNFTPTNLASTDQTTDTPTNNFSTLNPLAKYPNNGILSEGNTTFVGINAGNEYYNTSTFAFAQGKWYSEFKLTADPDGMNIGIMKTDLFGSTSPHSTSSAWTFTRGTKIHNGTSTSYGSTPSTNDILMMAVDMDNGKIWWGINGTFFNSGDPANGTNEAFSGISGEVYVLVNDDYSIRVPTCLCNFGNPSFSISSGNSDGNGYGNFEYAPPSGYLALCTQNLATELSPTIDDGSQYFNTVLTTGAGAGSYTGVGFQPDFLWFKRRDSSGPHFLIDSTRGSSKYLASESTASETTDATFLTSIDSDGWTGGSGFYGSPATLATWNWKANGGTTSSNTDGDETTTVQASTTSGFSIITYQPASTLSDQTTIGHGLGSSPDFLIYKNRDTSSHWIVYPMGISGQTNQAGFLSLTDAFVDANILGQGYFDNPTSTTIRFRTGSSGSSSGGSTNKHLIYAFKSINGYSSFGSYTGNGSTDGVMVTTMFRPAFVLTKRTDSAGQWYLKDTSRSSSGGFNTVGTYLKPNSSDAEGTNDGAEATDLLSNGFKQRNTEGNMNASGATYIYMAFAESPFVTSTGIPVTAR